MAGKAAAAAVSFLSLVRSAQIIAVINMWLVKLLHGKQQCCSLKKAGKPCCIFPAPGRATSNSNARLQGRAISLGFAGVLQQLASTMHQLGQLLQDRREGRHALASLIASSAQMRRWLQVASCAMSCGFEQHCC